MCLLKLCHVGVHRQKIEAPYPVFPLVSLIFYEWADALSKATES